MTVVFSATPSQNAYSLRQEFRHGEMEAAPAAYLKWRLSHRVITPPAVLHAPL